MLSEFVKRNRRAINILVPPAVSLMVVSCALAWTVNEKIEDLRAESQVEKIIVKEIIHKDGSTETQSVTAPQDNTNYQVSTTEAQSAHVVAQEHLVSRQPESAEDPENLTEVNKTKDNTQGESSRSHKGTSQGAAQSATQKAEPSTSKTSAQPLPSEQDSDTYQDNQVKNTENNIVDTQGATEAPSVPAQDVVTAQEVSPAEDDSQ